MTKRFINSAVALLLFAGCLGHAYCAAMDEHKGHAGHPRAATSGVMSLDVYAQGNTLHLLTGRSEDAGARSLWYQRSTDNGKTWSNAVRVDARAPVGMFRRGNDAQIAASGNRLLAVWTTRGTGWGGGGPLAAAISTDGGKSWQQAAAPADDKSTTTHAFSELFVTGERFALAWIDKRDGKTGVRYAELADVAKSWSSNSTVDATSCECCWNSAATKNGKSFLLYRGAMPRDMELASSADGSNWRRTSTVGTFNWNVEVCPETGGSLVVAPSGTMHALAWTGDDHALGLHYLASRDAGSTWDAPRRIGSEDARRSDMAAAADGTLAAVWDDTGDNLVRISISRDGGSRWSDPKPLSATGDRAIGPRVIAVNGTFLILWTQARAGGGLYELKTATVPRR